VDFPRYGGGGVGLDKYDNYMTWICNLKLFKKQFEK